MSKTNRLQLNAEKCKELIIDFKVARGEFDPIVINTKELCLVEHAKVLNVTISNALQCNNHVNNTIKKANKRLYFLVLLRRAKVSPTDIIRFYSTCIRPLLEYCSPCSIMLFQNIYLVIYNKYKRGRSQLFHLETVTTRI